MADPLLAALLDASRIRWAERPVGPQWQEWIDRTALNAFRGRAPAVTSVRIHSLPGSQWEMLPSADGGRCLIADDELTASLAEMRMLSTAAGTPDAGYDKAVLLLADAFRGIGDDRRFAACMGWALPRSGEILALRRSALTSGGSSAETMVVLLHELAHGVLAHDGDAFADWRELAAVGVGKIVEALSAGDFRERALRDGMAVGLTELQAAQQLQSYLNDLQSNPQLLEELSCDVLATVGLLNLRSPTDVFSDLDAGPTTMSTKEVGDALMTAHGAIQNMQLISAVHSISASASLRSAMSEVLPDRTTSELTARSSALVFLLCQLLQLWCAQGRLRDEWALKIAAGDPAFVRGVAHRNEFRAANLLGPLEDMDGALHDEQRFAHFENQASQVLRERALKVGSRNLDAARWALTMAQNDHGAR
jgi:hypothetical protein